ncbi:MAG TPA: hypothetical protein PLX33_07400 [Alphaproteobacteria bacterium]|nr:hypothetical protein [Alphaproteobacteria bacterium]
MSNFKTAKAALLSAFIAVAGCSDPAPATNGPEGGIFPGSFSFETDGLTHTMKDARHTVVFDFKSDTMTVTDSVARTSYVKSTNGPLSTAEESLARFAESSVCYGMHKDKFDRILADDNVESLTPERGCSANNGIARVNYRARP